MTGNNYVEQVKNKLKEESAEFIITRSKYRG